MSFIVSPAYFPSLKTQATVMEVTFATCHPTKVSLGRVSSLSSEHMFCIKRAPGSIWSVSRKSSLLKSQKDADNQLWKPWQPEGVRVTHVLVQNGRRLLISKPLVKENPLYLISEYELAQIVRSPAETCLMYKQVGRIRLVGVVDGAFSLVASILWSALSWNQS